MIPYENSPIVQNLLDAPNMSVEQKARDIWEIYFAANRSNDRGVPRNQRLRYADVLESVKEKLSGRKDDGKK